MGEYIKGCGDLTSSQMEMLVFIEQVEFKHVTIITFRFVFMFDNSNI